MRISKDLRLGKLVTPALDRQRPVYRWFLMKESFSSHFVRLLIKSWALSKEDFILDPFCGAGTVPLAAQEHGIKCLGYEVHPVLFLVSNVKTMKYDVGTLRAVAGDLLRKKFERVDAQAPARFSKLLAPHLLEDILFFRNKIFTIEESLRDFFLLALRNAVVKAGGLYREGAILRKREGKRGRFRSLFSSEIEKMLKDLELLKRRDYSTRLELRDAREMNPEAPVTAVITSPPYPLKQEYIEAYRLEEWLFMLPAQDPAAFLNFSPQGSTIEEAVEMYIKNISTVINRVFEVCGDGAEICFVVSDGGSKTGVVEACERTCRLAEEAGFKIKKMVVVNERWCTTPSRKKLGLLREALLFWEKKS